MTEPDVPTGLPLVWMIGLMVWLALALFGLLWEWLRDRRIARNTPELHDQGAPYDWRCGRHRYGRPDDPDRAA